MSRNQDKDLILRLAAELTGATTTAESPPSSLISNVNRLMEEKGFSSLLPYLQYVAENPDEHARLISALTIHTTSWFRENPHFVAFQEMLLETLQKKEVFNLWSAACSTGEEVYSFGLMLEEFRRVHPGFDYRILGTDIDPVSVEVARRACTRLSRSTSISAATSATCLKARAKPRASLPCPRKSEAAAPSMSTISGTPSRGRKVHFISASAGTS
ncbi:MAG: hypothetical protein HC902_05150 [Calothrix sp. SM1_5_4]|nr:hypothetical protein [Calothrix sp. SM1_5_4]